MVTNGASSCRGYFRSSAAQASFSLPRGCRLNRTLNSLKTLAATQEGMSGDWNRINPPLTRLRDDTPASAAAWFARPDGSYYTVQKGRIGQSLEDRSYFPTLMHGEDVIGSLVVSKSTGDRSIIVATPILSDGKVVGALGVSLSAARLAKRLDEEVQFPDDVVFYALDVHGRTALHKDTSLIFQFPSDIGDASLKSAVQNMLSEREGVVRYRFRGADRAVVFHRSETTRWTFAIGTISAQEGE
jgi:hypothetical protein